MNWGKLAPFFSRQFRGLLTGGTLWNWRYNSRTTIKPERKGLMKTPNPHSRQGNILVVVLVVTAIIGLILAGYLRWISQQNMLVMRSQSWNTALPFAEAGIEEALAHLNANGITNLNIAGWAPTNQAVMNVRAIKEGYYQVTIYPTNRHPVIESIGFAPPPLRADAAPASMTNTSSFPIIPAGYIQRRIRVTTTNDPLFARGMVAKGNIDFRGNNVRTDSFDSGDPQFSSGGQYDPNKNKDNGDVATNSGLVNSLNTGNANILGKVSTGPGGSIALGPNGAVGSKAWQEAGNRGVEAGWSSDDMNVNFPEVKQPFTSGQPPALSGGSLVLERNGQYEIQTLAKTLIVRSNIQASLLVTVDLSLTGQDRIFLEPGATLKLYVSAPSASLGGQGVINGGNATNFYYFGLPTNTRLSFGGNSAFTGSIYAPEADFQLGGGGSDVRDFVGASVTKTVQMNGHYKFHYDENLRRAGPPRQYVVTSWNEF